MNNNSNAFLFKDISTIKGVGQKLKKYLIKKKSRKLRIFCLICRMELQTDLKLQILIL